MKHCSMKEYEKTNLEKQQTKYSVHNVKKYERRNTQADLLRSESCSSFWWCCCPIARIWFKPKNCKKLVERPSIVHSAQTSTSSICDSEIPCQWYRSSVPSRLGGYASSCSKK